MEKVGYKNAASMRNELSAGKTVGVVETVAKWMCPEGATVLLSLPGRESGTHSFI